MCFLLNIFVSSDVKRTLVKVPLNQRDLLLKINILLNVVGDYKV